MWLFALYLCGAQIRVRIECLWKVQMQMLCFFGKVCILLLVFESPAKYTENGWENSPGFVAGWYGDPGLRGRVPETDCGDCHHQKRGGESIVHSEPLALLQAPVVSCILCLSTPLPRPPPCYSGSCRLKAWWSVLFSNKKSETRMTVILLKQDPNTGKFFFVNAYLILQNSMQIFGVSPFLKLQNDKLKCRLPVCFWLWYWGLP